MSIRDLAGARVDAQTGRILRGGLNAPPIQQLQHTLERTNRNIRQLAVQAEMDADKPVSELDKNWLAGEFTQLFAKEE